MKKVINFLSKNKKIIIISLIIISVIWIMFALNPKKEINLPTPTPLSDLNIKPEIFPKSGTIPFGGTTSAITMSFSKEILLNSIQIDVKPLITIKPNLLNDDRGRLILTPLEPWATDQTYTITIKSGIKSSSGQTITTEDIILQYQMSKPEPDVISPFL